VAGEFIRQVSNQSSQSRQKGIALAASFLLQAGFGKGADFQAAMHLVAREAGCSGDRLLPTTVSRAFALRAASRMLKNLMRVT
jgi:hypothetical protein